MSIRNNLIGGNDFIRNRYLVYDDLNDTFNELYYLITDTSLVSDTITTEAGDFLTTEAGDILVT